MSQGRGRVEHREYFRVGDWADDWKKREEEEREEKEEEERDRTAKRAKKAASWTDGPADAKEDISSKMASEFGKCRCEKERPSEMVEETNEKQAFEKFTKMARERAKGTSTNIAAKTERKALQLLRWLCCWNGLKISMRRVERRRKPANAIDEVEVDPRTCGVEVPKRYLPEYYKDSETKIRRIRTF